MSELESIITKAVETFISADEKQLIYEWEEIWTSLDESKKSHIIKILMGHGLVTKDKSGKLSKADPAKVKDTLSKIGIKS